MNSEPWRPYTDERDVIADDLGGNDNAEPGEVTALREAAAHLAGVRRLRGKHDLGLHHPSPDLVRWFLAQGRQPLTFQSGGEWCCSFHAPMCDVTVTIIVSDSDEAWPLVSSFVPRVVGPGEEDAA